MPYTPRCSKRMACAVRYFLHDFVAICTAVHSGVLARSRSAFEYNLCVLFFMCYNTKQPVADNNNEQNDCGWFAEKSRVLIGEYYRAPTLLVSYLCMKVWWWYVFAHVMYASHWLWIFSGQQSHKQPTTLPYFRVLNVILREQPVNIAIQLIFSHLYIIIMCVCGGVCSKQDTLKLWHFRWLRHCYPHGNKFYIAVITTVFYHGFRALSLFDSRAPHSNHKKSPRSTHAATHTHTYVHTVGPHRPTLITSFNFCSKWKFVFLLLRVKIQIINSFKWNTIKMKCYVFFCSFWMRIKEFLLVCVCTVQRVTRQLVNFMGENGSGIKKNKNSKWDERRKIPINTVNVWTDSNTSRVSSLVDFWPACHYLLEVSLNFVFFHLFHTGLV